MLRALRSRGALSLRCPSMTETHRHRTSSISCAREKLCGHHVRDDEGSFEADDSFSINSAGVIVFACVRSKRRTEAAFIMLRCELSSESELLIFH